MTNQDEVLNKLLDNSDRTLATVGVLTEVIAHLYTKIDPTAKSYELILKDLRQQIASKLMDVKTLPSNDPHTS